MQLQPITKSQTKKPLRKVSMSSQLRTSGILQSRGLAQLNKNSIQNSHMQFHSVFDSKNMCLEATYCQTFTNITESSKSLMHVGLCLPVQEIFSIFKLIFQQNNKLSLKGSRIRDKGQNFHQIMFVPYWSYQIQDCHIIFWVLNDSAFIKQYSFKQKSAIFDVFIHYPQIFITTNAVFNALSNKRSNFYEKLSFHQKILILQNKNTNIFSKNKQIQNATIEKIFDTGIKTLNQNFLLTMKRNSTRCFDEILKINLYIIQVIISRQKNNQDQTEIFKAVISRYLTEEISNKYQTLAQNYKNAAKHEKQIEDELNTIQQETLKELDSNLQILNKLQNKDKIIQAAHKTISGNTQQIIYTNRQLSKKQNNQILNDLYEQLLSQFDKGKYFNQKTKTNLMAQDFIHLMQEYEKKGIKSGSFFWVFNVFVRNQKNQFYSKVQQLEQQVDDNRKSHNFQQIDHKISLKKKVLMTLEKQVKDLQGKKAQVDAQNDHLKKLQKQFNERVDFQTEGEELVEAESIKTLKAVPAAITSKKKNSASIAIPQNQKSIQKKKSTVKKKKQCCKCVIF